ncbi:ThiF family adenylyltransferase [Ideonella sp. 4Y16]|uniref:ThiF family adenylyltransferase n=1 Tax=Ideonella alba TaxID=2824118 RepID=UPI001B36CD84|nr:ThiF family adenylyltransferase [Ideonella alba]MBQ0942237.1 ThiF family adenylyltransferase [Ideonella alba]
MLPTPNPDPAPTALCLPRAQLDTLLHLALARPAQPPHTLLAHAPLVLQPAPGGLQALAGPLSTQRLRALPPQPGHPPEPPPTHGLVLVAVASPGAPPPQGDAACEAWLLQHAPGFRLATAAINPALVLLWLRLDGQATLLFRHGRQPASAGAPRWVPVPQLHLPGGGMQRVDLAATTGRQPDPEPDANEPDPGPDDRRDSRHLAAFGAAPLRHLQRSHIVLVGAGRVGSVFAHGLVRLGVQRLTVIEPDHMEPHNEDGDVAPLCEGRPKVEALQRFVRGLQRPGAVLDLQPWPVSSARAGALIAQADAVLVCVDNDAARLWANAWALAHNRCLLAVATRVQPQGAEADLRLLPAGSGCLACVGGYVQRAELLQQLALDGPVPTPADFRQQRQGSLRSWSALAAHLGQRLLEQHLLRPGGGALFRQLQETPQGGLQVRDWRPEDDGRPRACPFCSTLQGAGQAAVTPQRLRALVRLWLDSAM